MKIAAVILAGGEGTRIGGGKPLIQFGGTTLLDRAIQFALTQSVLVAVAVRDIQQVGEIGVAVIRDDPKIEGPLAGLVGALRFAVDEGVDAVLTLPADMPFLPSDLADRLAKELASNRAAIARSGGHLHPVCGLWLAGALDSVPAYVASSRRSLRGLAEATGYAAVDWPADLLDPFFNINTPADLTAAEQLLQR
jgi:molybdopterin-guanine dinucleotide biosynthesis protein A